MNLISCRNGHVHAPAPGATNRHLLVEYRTRCMPIGRRNQHGPARFYWTSEPVTCKTCLKKTEAAS